MSFRTYPGEKSISIAKLGNILSEFLIFSGFIDHSLMRKKHYDAHYRVLLENRDVSRLILADLRIAPGRREEIRETCTFLSQSSARAAFCYL